MMTAVELLFAVKACPDCARGMLCNPHASEADNLEARMHAHVERRIGEIRNSGRWQPATPFLRECTCVGSCKGAAGLAPGWKCMAPNSEINRAPVLNKSGESDVCRVCGRDDPWTLSNDGLCFDCKNARDGR